MPGGYGVYAIFVRRLIPGTGAYGPAFFVEHRYQASRALAVREVRKALRGFIRAGDDV
jgi:hypothetical protein